MSGPMRTGSQNTTFSFWKWKKSIVWMKQGGLNNDLTNKFWNSHISLILHYWKNSHCSHLHFWKQVFWTLASRCMSTNCNSIISPNVNSMSGKCKPKYFFIILCINNVDFIQNLIHIQDLYRANEYEGLLHTYCIQYKRNTERFLDKHVKNGNIPQLCLGTYAVSPVRRKLKATKNRIWRKFK